MALRPRASTPSIACRYTSVLRAGDAVDQHDLPLRALDARVHDRKRFGLTCGKTGLRARAAPTPFSLGSAAPRIRLLLSTRTTPSTQGSSPWRKPRRTRGRAPPCADRPRRRASTTAACLTAFLRGAKSSAAGPSVTQRSSTSPPTAGSSRRHEPSREANHARNAARRGEQAHAGRERREIATREETRARSALLIENRASRARARSA